MYEEKRKEYFIIAILYWLISIVCFWLMGVMYQRHIPYDDILYYALFAVVILIVLLKDKSIRDLGFTKEKIKINLVIALLIISVAFIASLFFSFHTWDILVKRTIYYLLYVAFIEEIIYRGFIQNYLFGLKVRKFLIYLLGALLFSLMHLPFQMYVYNNVSLDYVITAIPQLVSCFLFHLVMCFITYVRKDITIPIALHYAIDYIQSVL